MAKKKTTHTHMGSIITMGSGEKFSSIFNRDVFNEKITEARRSGGFIMNTSKYGYSEKGTLESRGDISIYIDHVESVEPMELEIEVAPKTKE